MELKRPALVRSAGSGAGAPCWRWHRLRRSVGRAWASTPTARPWNTASDDDSLAGFDVDLMRAIGRHRRVQNPFRRRLVAGAVRAAGRRRAAGPPWARAPMSCARQTLITSARRVKYLVSHPYLDAGQILAVRWDSKADSARRPDGFDGGSAWRTRQVSTSSTAPSAEDAIRCVCTARWTRPSTICFEGPYRRRGRGPRRSGARLRQRGLQGRHPAHRPRADRRRASGSLRRPGQRRPARQTRTTVWPNSKASGRLRRTARPLGCGSVYFSCTRKAPDGRTVRGPMVHRIET